MAIEARKRILLPSREPILRKVGLPLGIEDKRFFGFAPTEQSATGMGELAMLIGDEFILFRHANGLEVLEFQLRRSDFRVMTPDEIAEKLGDPETFGRYTGSSHLIAGISLIFLKDFSADKPALTILGTQRNAQSQQALLFSSDQVKRGLQREVLIDLERESGNKGATPRLRSRGRALRITQRLFSK